MSRDDVHDKWVTPHTVSHAIAHARSEVLIALPGSSFPRESLQDLTDTVRAALARNAAVEIICQHPTRFNEPVKHFVREVGAAGGQVRTLEEFFRQLVVVDRAVAFVSMLDPDTKGAVIRDPVVVGFLVDLYERHWTRAVDHPFQPTHAARAVGEVGLPLREALIRMLVSGHPDKQIARRLGLSLRSTAEHVARLKSELGAKNRTEMGYLLAKRELAGGMVGPSVAVSA
ncbi:LuxR C-terminal-related transcriptional regulator [Streptomyces sp. T028]|uniref:helix-turn-helix transcriptional regulator n=1 Tax=Streptomyces sp. T028 TaxID=3394379 RepID=UPI003A88ED9A